VRDFIVAINTTRCNMHCMHCLRGKYEKHHDLDPDVLKRTLGEARELGYRHISFTGGEPALHPKFEMLTDIAAGQGFFISFVTNGLEYERYAPIITKHAGRMRYASVSLDGATEVTHDRIRKKGSFARACEAILHFRQQGIYTTVVFTTNSLNKGELSQGAKLVDELGANLFYVSSYIDTGADNGLSLTPSEKLGLYKEYLGLLKRYPGKLSYTTSFYATREPESFCSNMNEHCPTINALGQMIFCCDNISQGAVIGDMKKERFSDVLIKGLKAGIRLREMRKQMIEENKVFDGFDSCEFCNKVLRKDISFINKGF